MSPMTRAGAEFPILRLGLAGFTPAQEAMLGVALARRAAERQMEWQVSSLGEADAWCVNGSGVRGLPDGTWRIMPARDQARPVRINPDEIDWPVAFSTPFALPDMNPPYRFDLNSPPSIQAVLERLEGWLRPVMLQFCLASHIVRNEVDLGSGAYHVTVNGKLYAIVSRRSGVGVWPIANPSHLMRAEWHHRPESADAIPSTFIRTGLPEAMWQYATRTAHDCLPAHYRRKRLYLRRPPPLPIRLLSDRCLRLVRELSRGPGTLHELVQRTGAAGAELARHIAALRLVGAVTADASRLARPSEGDWNSSLVGGQADSGGVDLEMTVRLKAIEGDAEAMN